MLQNADLQPFPKQPEVGKMMDPYNLGQGCQTQGLGAKSGPRLHFMRPHKSLQRI